MLHCKWQNVTKYIICSPTGERNKQKISDNNLFCTPDSIISHSNTPLRDHFVVTPINSYLCLLTAGFKLKQNDLDENPVRTYHRIIEAFKFAYKYRSMLADPDYEKDVNKVCCHKELLSFCLGLLVRGNAC